MMMWLAPVGCMFFLCFLKFCSEAALNMSLSTHVCERDYMTELLMTVKRCRYDVGTQNVSIIAYTLK